MRRRNFGLSDEDRLYSISMEKADKNDLLAIAGYLFIITKNIDNELIFDEEQCFTILVKLAENLSKKERLDKVVFNYVYALQLAGKLHYHENFGNEEIEEDDFDELEQKHLSQRTIRRMKAKKTFVFAEDETISDRNLKFLDMPEGERNYYRILVKNGKGVYSQILYHTFFSKAEVDIKEFHKELPARFEKKIHDISKLDFLRKELHLSDAETEYLLFRYRKGTIQIASEVLNTLTCNSIGLYTEILGITKKQFQQITRRDSKLFQYGFIDEERILNPVLMECIEAQDFSIYFTDCIKTQEISKTYALSSFSVPAKNTKIYKSLLESENPVSILLYGAPGSGKTEYAKSLIKSAGKKAIIFKNESETMPRDDALNCLNCLLSLDRKDSVLIVDEAESVLNTRVETLFGESVSPKKKGIINKMLENSKNKVIWIVNYKSQMDESTLRRFTVSHKFEPMTSSMLENIASRKLQALELEASTRKDILKLLSKYQVTGASVDNLIKTVTSMNSKNEKELLENIDIVLQDNSTLLHGKAKMRTKVKDFYDLGVLNTSISAKKIMNMLVNAKKYADKNPGNGAVRMLFYGLSGTGKTEFARYISTVLGKDILLKRASDIFDKYVGETEKRIAAAFEEAAANDQILLFDEADSFFADRNNAERNFERTQVNEFLTQLEEFPGIVICTTNLRGIMEPAMLRRFHLTVDFKALTKEGIETLLHRFFKDYDFADKDIEKLVRYDSVTPGDFSRIADSIRFMDPDELNGPSIIDQLCDIQKEKNENEHTHKRVGFCA